MKEVRQQQMLQSCTGLARKVFEFVPIQEAWSAQQINTAMRTGTNSAADHRAVRACLGDMKDQGIIREPKLGYFQRFATKDKTVLQPYQRTIEIEEDAGRTRNGMIIKEDKSFKKSVAANQPEGNEVSMSSNEVVATVSGQPKRDEQTGSSIDMLTELAIDLGDFATSFTQKLKAFAGRIEDIAQRVETDAAESADKLVKLEALKTLLKSLG